ncbi:MAG: hypothetical protein EXR79_15595 [Myxococcales bacterium]|nr:hypothetical protein [Myxococcales bacterium]
MADEFDFLDDPDVHVAAGAAGSTRAEAATALEAVRGDLLDWAAVAVCVRSNHVARRGRRGELQARQDLDFCVRHVHAALAHGNEGDAGTALRQVAALLATRGVDAAQWRADVAVLIEAVRRFMPLPAGRSLADDLESAVCGGPVAPIVVAR